ncbi:MAG: DUF3592 domain-containing protein [Candidatus Hydrogenedentes bacterium]|nr:DUF3592 domain-containing protein [Candidatus Hydrogenedentota bacterium]
MGLDTSSTSKPVPNKSARGIGFLILFGLPFLLAGAGIIYFFSVRPLLQLFAAQSWETVPCTILSSEIETSSSDDGATYRIRIKYTYTIDGNTFDGDDYNFLDYASSGLARKQRVVDQYPPGSSAACHVNPNEPGQSVLSIALGPGYFVGLFGLIFAAVGAGLMFAGTRGGKMHEARLARAKAAAAKALPSAVEDPNGRELKAAGSPVGAAIALFVFGAIWNGITFTILYQTWGDGLFPTLFLSIFLFIGIAVALGFVYAVLAIFNPRPRLFLAPGQVRLAGAATLDYEFSGATHRIRRLRIYLEGREEARYRRGTDTVRVEHLFLRQVLLDSQDQTIIDGGRAQLTFPEYSMHTFTAANNKIFWVLKIHGEIARWPDVNESFEIEVLPLGG